VTLPGSEELSFTTTPQPTLTPYGRQSVDDSDVAAVVAALRSDWLTTGPAVTRFEEDLARVTDGVPCVSVTSGTAALHVAYAALGVSKGTEVITTPLTFVATASCASLLGARIVFADTEEETGNISPAAVDALATERTKVISAVDYAGQPADYDALSATASRIVQGPFSRQFGRLYNFLLLSHQELDNRGGWSRSLQEPGHRASSPRISLYWYGPGPGETARSGGRSVAAGSS
jgi:hypothetical protein